MSIIITKISFNNFRQYRKIDVRFESSGDNNLHVLQAKNGTGKTTFLNAITWCLYGEEKYLPDKEKALQIVNEAAVKEKIEGDEITTSVLMTIKDTEENKFITFERKQLFRIKEDKINKINRAIGNTSSLTVSITKINSTENSIITDSDDASFYVDSYFNRNIYDYYFFDGENLRNYFAKGKAEKIKESIFNISQVTLLENAKKRADDQSVKNQRLVNKNNPISDDLIDEQIKLQNDIEQRNNEIKKAQSQIPEYEKKRNEANDIKSSYSQVKIYYERQKDKTKGRERLLKQSDELINEQNAFIQEYLVLLNFYPKIVKTYEMICLKEKNNELPPDINKKEIKEIIDNHLLNCPVCNSKLDDEAYVYLQKMLDQTAVSNTTSNQLMLIKSSLELMMEDAKNYSDKKYRLINREKEIRGELADVDKDLSQIHSYLVNYSDDKTESKISDAEKDYQYYNGKIDEAKSLIISNNAYNERDSKRLKDVEKQLEKIDNDRKEKTRLSHLVKVYRRVASAFNDIQKEIMLSMRNEIENETWKTFSAMIWKKNTFKSLKITDNYDLSVYSIDNKLMTGSLSATEYMALAYSFTLAIHNESGKNCPLVVDSPLGRVSDENRENMSRELLKVANNKQIIMLFTPDEYSKEVEDIYKEKAASIRIISLSDDEQEIKGVDYE